MSDPHFIFGVAAAGRKGQHPPISIAVETVVVGAGRPTRAELPLGRRDDRAVASGRRATHRSRLDTRSAGSRRSSETGSRKLFGERRFAVDHRLFGLRRIGRLSDRLALANRLARTVHAIATHLLASVRLLVMDGHDPVVMLRMLLIVFSADMIPAGAGIASQGAILVVDLSRRATDLGVRAVAVEAAVRTAAMRPATTRWAPTRTLVVYWSHIQGRFLLFAISLGACRENRKTGETRHSVSVTETVCDRTDLSKRLNEITPLKGTSNLLRSHGQRSLYRATFQQYFYARYSDRCARRRAP